VNGSDLGAGGQTTQYAYEATDPELARKARLTVAHHAIDTEDCAELLDMLNLRGDPS
jgi:hypothetical protein